MSKKAFAVLFLILHASANSTARLQQYQGVQNGSLCINARFVEVHPDESGEIGCAAICSSVPRCQAFTTADGPCQLFVFDKCSRSVRDCSCVKRGRLFVKRQPGLSAGSLCPTGYGDERCGVKYKMLMGSGVWTAQRQVCEFDGELTTMADVIDSAEMSHVNYLFAKHGSKGFYLGGWQVPGSDEPAGGWVWAGCNTTIDGTLWVPGEPNNGVANENAIMRVVPYSKLVDVTGFLVRRALCECVSPFD